MNISEINTRAHTHTYNVLIALQSNWDPSILFAIDFYLLKYIKGIY